MTDDARSRIAAELEKLAEWADEQARDTKLFVYQANHIETVAREAAAALRLPRVEALQESVDSIHEHLLAAVRAESPVPRVEARGPLRALAEELRDTLKAIYDDAVGERRDPLWIVKRDLVTSAHSVLAKADALLAAPVATKGEG